MGVLGSLWLLLFLSVAEQDRIQQKATLPSSLLINTLRPRQNGRHLADDILKRIFLDIFFLI